MQGAFERQARLFGILDDEFIDAMNQCMFQAWADILLPPGQVTRHLRALALPAVLLGHLQQAVGRIIATIQDYILNALAELSVDIVINVQLAGIHNPHIHARTDRMEEENRVHGPTHRLIATEGERDVRQPA